MKIRLFSFILCILSLFLTHGQVEVQAASREKDTKHLVFQMINAAREDPLGTAEALGYDTEQLLERLSTMRHILKVGLPPLKWNQRLAASAQGHALDMQNNGYVAKISPAGLGPADRMLACGFDPLYYEERLGIMTLQNFVSPAAAAKTLFTSIFRDELVDSPEMPRTILNPLVNEVGISFLGGSFGSSIQAQNAYVLVSDFGTSSIRETELKIFRDINHIWRKALGSADEPDMLQANETYQVCPILAWSEALAFQAQERAEAILSDYNLGTRGDELLQNRAFHADDVVQGTRFVEMAFEINGEPSDLHDTVTSHMATRIQEQGPEVFPFLVKEDIEAVGIDVYRVGSLDLGQDSSVYLVILAFGRIEGNGGMVHGRVYADVNANGLFDFGEGCDGLIVYIPRAPYEQAYATVTRPDGWFQISARNGLYPLRVLSEDIDILTESFIAGTGQNIHHDIRLSTGQCGY